MTLEPLAPRDRLVRSLVGYELDEDAGVGAALVQLARGVEETRAESERCRQPSGGSDADSQSLQPLLAGEGAV